MAVPSRRPPRRGAALVAVMTSAPLARAQTFPTEPIKSRSWARCRTSSISRRRPSSTPSAARSHQGDPAGTGRRARVHGQRPLRWVPRLSLPRLQSGQVGRTSRETLPERLQELRRAPACRRRPSRMWLTANSPGRSGRRFGGSRTRPTGEQKGQTPEARQFSQRMVEDLCNENNTSCRSLPRRPIFRCRTHRGLKTSRCGAPRQDTGRRLRPRLYSRPDQRPSADRPTIRI